MKIDKINKLNIIYDKISLYLCILVLLLTSTLIIYTLFIKKLFFLSFILILILLIILFYCVLLKKYNYGIIRKNKNCIIFPVIIQYNNGFFLHNYKKEYCLNPNNILYIIDIGNSYKIYLNDNNIILIDKKFIPDELFILLKKKHINIINNKIFLNNIIYKFDKIIFYPYYNSDK